MLKGRAWKFIDSVAKLKNTLKLYVSFFTDTQFCFSQGADEQGNVSQLIEDFHAERYQLELARDDYKIKCETLEVGTSFEVVFLLSDPLFNRYLPAYSLPANPIISPCLS